MSADAAVRMEALYTGVLAPLVLGGELRPVRPIGPRLAREIASLADAFVPSDDELASRFEEARRARAVRIAPIDVLPRLGRAEWLLAAALGDLLQVANPHLVTLVARGRAARLLEATETTISLVPPPRDLAACLVRHATFGGALAIRRTDVRVEWWTGSATFRGETPPRRLLAWPGVRRVRTDTSTATIDEVGAHADVAEGSWAAALARWLAKTPLTDLASAGRDAPPFAWTGATLAVVATAAGRAMARRATSSGGPRVDVALERATRAIAGHAAEAAIARRFVDDRRAHAIASP